MGLGAKARPDEEDARVLKGPQPAVDPNHGNTDASNYLAAPAQGSDALSQAPLPALPGGLALNNEFRQLFEFTNGTVKGRLGTCSKFEFQLTLKNVQPGQTQRTLEDLVEEMNPEFRNMPNYPSRGFQVYLSGNGDLPNYREPGNVVFTCSSLIHDSTNRARNWSIRCNGKERMSHEELLCQLDLFWQPNDIVQVTAGMCRLALGFPNAEVHIGQKCDRGDMFEGKAARTGRGRVWSSSASHKNGVSQGLWWGGEYDHADEYVGVVGGDAPKLIMADRRMEWCEPAKR